MPRDPEAHDLSVRTRLLLRPAPADQQERMCGDCVREGRAAGIACSRSGTETFGPEASNLKRAAELRNCT